MKTEVLQILVKSMETKEQIRKNILSIRSQIQKNELIEKSNIIQNRLFALKKFIEADNILFYADYNHEVMTHQMMISTLSCNKSVYCPKVCGNQILFYKISQLEELKGFYKGIQEPLECQELNFAMNHQKDKSLVIMPGVAFDQKRNRLGYGKGYYDKFLSNNAALDTVALALECQIVEHIPATEFDIRPDCIITEDRLI